MSKQWVRAALTDLFSSHCLHIWGFCRSLKRYAILKHQRPYFMKKELSHWQKNYKLYTHFAIALLSVILIKDLFSLPIFDLNLDKYANIATIIQSVAALGIAIQILLSNQEIRADHERSRREKSIDVLVQWSNNLTKENSITRKILDNLSEDQCKNILNQEEVKVLKKHEPLLQQLFGQNLDAPVDDYIVIKASQSAELRWNAITYLNSLEFTFVAWQYSVVDRKIIEDQFQYLFNPDDGSEVLKNFRKAAGGSLVFPAIEIFTTHITQKSKERLIQKSNVA